MNTEKKIETFANELLGESLAHDQRGLWRIPAFLRDDLGIETESERRTLTMKTVELLLDKGMVAGNFIPSLADKNYSVWQDWRDADPKYRDKKEVLARISTEWDALGHEPNLYEVVWFRRPDPFLSPISNPKPQGPK
jgi:hypothetical protein